LNRLINVNMDTIPIKISRKWLTTKFVCNPDFIANNCKGRCCDGSRKTTLISLLPEEEDYHRSLGMLVEDSKICANEETKKCPHKKENGLCGLHVPGNKPFGCTVSPFKVNTNNTLILRHRYILMPCFKYAKEKDVGQDGVDYAYNIFREGLIKIFGKDKTLELN
jgi:hypothetical protein